MKKIIEGVVGSRAYGTHTIDSDTDIMSVVIPGEDHYFGMNQWGSQGTLEEKSEQEKTERTHYEIRKFVRMCAGFNPNVVPLLYLDKYKILDKLGEMIIANRYLFSSKLCVHSFGGFALGQLEKMDTVSGRMGAARKELRNTYGYDTKYLYHAIRLSMMCNEFILSNGSYLNVDRTFIDADFLKSIRRGSISREDGENLVRKMVEENKKIVNNIDLPDKPDMNKINKLVISILKEHFKNG